MFVGILTLPPSINYGGILQAYALQSVLELLGHKVVILDRRNPSKMTLINFLIKAKSFVYRYLLFNRTKYAYDERKEEYFNSEYIPFVYFINKRLNISSPLYTTKVLTDYVISNRFDVIIVGSDQVWRSNCSPCLNDYFLDFLCGYDIKKLSYAASFGSDKCEFQKKEVENYSILLRHFDAISVREFSSIKMCSDILGVNAIHVLDPTMLLTKNDYLKLVSDSDCNDNISSPFLFTYILDGSCYKKEIVEKLSNKLNLEIKSVPISLEQGNFLTIPQWLYYINKSEYVVTDSFHGCVFSIIFNKPFVAIANKMRGLNRFISLLTTFNLLDRLIYDNDVIDIDVLNKSINWDNVNSKWGKMKDDSILFLKNNL